MFRLPDVSSIVYPSSNVNGNRNNFRKVSSAPNYVGYSSNSFLLARWRAHARRAYGMPLTARKRLAVFRKRPKGVPPKGGVSVADFRTPLSRDPLSRGYRTPLSSAPTFEGYTPPSGGLPPHPGGIPPERGGPLLGGPLRRGVPALCRKKMTTPGVSGARFFARLSTRGQFFDFCKIQQNTTMGHP